MWPSGLGLKVEEDLPSRCTILTTVHTTSTKHRLVRCAIEGGIKSASRHGLANKRGM